MERAITAVRPDAYRLARFICVSACKIDPYGGVIGIQF